MPEQDKAYKQKSAVAGNGLFAQQEIAAGDLIFSLGRPLIAVPDNANVESCCANCFASKGVGATDSRLEVKACTACKAVRYCSKSCQSQSWKRNHKFECPAFRSLGNERQLPNATRAVMQVLSMKKHGLISEADWEALQELPAHLDEMSSEPEWEKHAVLAMGALKYSGTDDMFNSSVATGIYARVLTNSLTVIGSALEPLGICLDPFACAANHSCDPNAFVVMDGPQLSYRTLKPIGKGEEIFISYIDTTDPYARRQKELKERYRFSCTCSKCQHGPTLREDGLLQTPSDASVEEKGFEKLEQTRRGEVPAQAGLRFCKDTKAWAADRQPYAALRDEHIVECLYVQRFVEAWMHGVRRYFDTDAQLYPQPHHPVRVVHNWTLASLTLFMAQDAHAELAQKLGPQFGKLNLGVVLFGVLVETAANVAASHGAGSSFAKMVRAKMEEVRVDMTRGDAGVLRGMKARVEEQWRLLRSVGGMLEY